MRSSEGQAPVRRFTLPNPKSRTPHPTFSVPQVDLWSQHHECQADIRAAIDAVVDESAFISGRFVRKFEAAFAEYCGVRQCIGVGNGADTFALALRAVGVGPGDAVVTVPLAEACARECLSLPLFPHLSEEQVAWVCDSVWDWERHARSREDSLSRAES
jgi:dTDP-4-amino-4,6-dideoxygalactose transaminase